MNELTKNQEKALREFLHEAIVPLIEGVLVKKLGQAMSYAKEQLDTPKRKWVGLTDEEIDAMYLSFVLTNNHSEPSRFLRLVEAKLKELNG